jgi:ubiquinol-cytochrome c reductase cytochrome b subunit
MLTKIKKKPCDLDEIKWNQWLAGVIDGDGYLAIQKNNIAVCEITMPLEDEAVLFQIKQKLGGNIKLRSGSCSIRYRLSHKTGMNELLTRVNGFIRNTIRVIQFQKLCKIFNIIYLKAEPLSIYDGYIAGFFDANGSIYMCITKTSQQDSIKSGTVGKIERLINARGNHQIRISIRNKYLENIKCFKKALGFGKIQAVGKNAYKNHIYLIDLKNIPKFIEYTKKYPLRSSKKKRIFLLRKYFELKYLKAYLANENSLLGKEWINFCYKWYDYDFLNK